MADDITETSQTVAAGQLRTIVSLRKQDQAERQEEESILIGATPSPAVMVKPLNFFTTNVDGWGAAEWFDRLAKAIREQDKAVVAGNDLGVETYRNIAASSAMRLVRDYEAGIRSALVDAPAATWVLPDGWVAVPREPLPEMIGAWYRVKNGHHFHDEPAPTDRSDYAAYRAMIAAAPGAEGA